MKRVSSRHTGSAAPPKSPPLSPVNREALPLLGSDSLRTICTAPGPFITVCLPARHPGAPDLSRAERLKTIVRETGLELVRRRFLGNIDNLMKPLTRLSSEADVLSGGSDSVIFLSPAIFHRFRLLAPTPESVTIAAHPHITPLLANMISHRDFYVLALGKKKLRLGRWQDAACTEVTLPPGVPSSFEESRELDQPDHDLQNHTRAGSSADHAASTRFGTGWERDLAHDRLRQYLQAVDRELSGVLANAPLVLVGTEEELGAYRAASGYPRIFCAKPASPEHLSWVELGELARQALMAARREEAEAVLREFRETCRRDRVLSGLRDVLEASHAGRVHRLLVEKDATQTGLLGPNFSAASMGIEGEQDLINAAAVETIRNRGEITVVEPGELREAGPMAAILRYPG